MDISISMINSEEHCSAAFQYEYILNIKPEERGQLATEGIDTHQVFHAAHKESDVVRMLAMEKRDSVYTYLRDLALSKLPQPPPRREEMLVSNWAKYFAEYFWGLKLQFGSDIEKLKHYWYPIMSERKLRDTELGIVGKPDGVFYVPSPDGIDKILVLDYKTKAPTKKNKGGDINVKTGKREAGSLDSKQMRQLHVYMYLVARELKVDMYGLWGGMLFLGDFDSNTGMGQPLDVVRPFGTRSYNVAMKHVTDLRKKIDDPNTIWVPKDKVIPAACEGKYGVILTPCPFRKDCQFYQEYVRLIGTVGLVTA